MRATFRVLPLIRGDARLRRLPASQCRSATASGSGGAVAAAPPPAHSNHHKRVGGQKDDEHVKPYSASSDPQIV
eukprot:1180785-Prorocentrum_minimum.AAC.2